MPNPYEKSPGEPMALRTTFTVPASSDGWVATELAALRREIELMRAEHPPQPMSSVLLTGRDVINVMRWLRARET